MKFFRGKHINEAQIITFILLNTLIGGLMFITVFTFDTETKSFWSNYSTKVDRLNQAIIERSKLYDMYQDQALLESIKKDLLILESYFFYTKRGGIIKLKKDKELDIHQVLHKEIFNQIEILYQVFKEQETQLNRSIATLRAKPNNRTKDTYLVQIHKFSRALEIENKKLREIIGDYQAQKAIQRYVFLICCLLTLMLLNGFLIFRLHKDIFVMLREITSSLQSHFIKNASLEEDQQLDDTIGKLKNTVSVFIGNVENASAFAKKIGNGELDASVENLDTSNILGKALLEMQNKLEKVTDEDSKRNWISQGIAQVSDVLSGHQKTEFKEKVFLFTKMVADYMQCNQGAVFLASENKGKEVLKLFAAYAYEKKKYIEKEFDIDDGLIGQCFQERDSMYLEDIPNDYIHITSGLGHANPRSVLLLPILLDEECFGVLELASFKILPDYYLSFGKLISDKLATAIQAFKMNQHTNRLLADSRKMNEELTLKEEQMQNYTAQLSKEYSKLNTQLEAAKVTEKEVSKLTFLEEEIASMRAKLIKYQDLLAVNKKELSFQDKKLEKKENRISFLQDRLMKIKGKSVEEETLDIEKIALLESENVELKKVIQKLEGEKLLNQSTLNSINKSIPSAELNLKGEIIATNELFLELFGFENEELLDRHESILISPTPEVNALNEKKWNTLLKGQSFETELRFFKKDKDTLLRKASYTPVKSPSGRLFKVILLIQGITV